ncbi:MAG: cytidylate kinase-like family protein [Lachnospiraceae bacterium]|nr:cytidylate kinase-like family protein [Lachnospiraceae bacterium]
MQEHYVITIAREFGSGGKEIGVKAGELLGIPCYEKEIMTKASEYSGLKEELFENVDERLRGNILAKKLLRVPKEYVVEPVGKTFTSDDNLFHIQAEIIEELYKTESCIIVGKCADSVLIRRWNTISVFIGAPFRDCVHSIMERMKVPEAKAQKLVKETNKYRADYYKYYTRGKDWKDPMNYSLYLNSAKVGRDMCAQIIADYARAKFKDLI